MAGVLSIAMIAGLIVSFAGIASSPGGSATASDPSPSPSPSSTIPQQNQSNGQIIADVAQASLGQKNIYQSCYLAAQGDQKSGGSNVYVITDSEKGGMWYQDTENDAVTVHAGYPTGKGAWMSLGTEQSWYGALSTAEINDVPAPNKKEAAQILKEAGVPSATWIQFPEDGSVIYGTKPTAEYGYLMRGMQMLSAAYQGLMGVPDPQPSGAASSSPSPSPSPSPTPLSTSEFVTNDDGTSTLTVTPPNGGVPVVMTIGEDGLFSQVKNDPGLKCDFQYAAVPAGVDLMKTPTGAPVTWEKLKPALTSYAERKRAAGETNTTPVGDPITVKVGEDGQVEVQSPAASPEATSAAASPSAGPSAGPTAGPQPSPAAS